jgi:hypothetical protein
VEAVSLTPTQHLRDPEVAALAEEATRFLLSHPWCHSIRSSHLAWAVPGVLGVFLFRIVPSRPNVDERLWVVVGDLPAAYLVCDDAPTWHEALQTYCSEMTRWVEAVRAGTSLEDVIPVRTEPTLEHAAMLASRLEFVRTKILTQEVSSGLRDS